MEPTSKTRTGVGAPGVGGVVTIPTDTITLPLRPDGDQGYVDQGYPSVAIYQGCGNHSCMYSVSPAKINR